ncbi:hypothetical protein [Roseivivax sp. CAU 1761]
MADITTGMTLADVRASLPGYDALGSMELTLEDGTVLGSRTMFERAGGDEIVIVDTAADGGSAGTAALRYQDPSELEQAEAALTAKYGEVISCQDPEIGFVFHYGVGGSLIADADCSTVLNGLDPMQEASVHEVFEGDERASTVAVAFGQDEAGRAFVMETVQANNLSARIHAAAMGIEVPSEDEAAPATHAAVELAPGEDPINEILSRDPRGEAAAELLDGLLTTKFPVPHEGFKIPMTRREAVSLLRDNNASFFTRDGKIRGHPKFEDSSLDVALHPGYKRTAQAVAEKVLKSPAKRAPALQTSFTAKSKFDNGVLGTFVVGSEVDPSGGIGIESSRVFEVSSYFDLSETNLDVTEDDVRAWVQRTFEKACTLEERRTGTIFFSASNNLGDRIGLDEAPQPGCGSMARQYRDTGYTNLIEVAHSPEGVVSGIAVKFMDHATLYEALRKAYEWAQGDGLEEEQTAQAALSRGHSGGPEPITRAEEQTAEDRTPTPTPSEVPEFMSAEGGVLPAVFGYELGMNAGEAVSRLKSEGYRFFQNSFMGGPLKDEPAILDLTDNLSLEEYVTLALEETGSDRRNVQLLGVAAQRTTNGYKDTVLLQVAQTVGSEFAEGQISLLTGLRTYPSGEQIRPVEVRRVLNDERMQGSGCFSAIHGGMETLLFWDKDGKTVIPPDMKEGVAPGACHTWEARTPHQYRGKITTFQPGEKVDTLRVILEDHEAVLGLIK